VEERNNAESFDGGNPKERYRLKQAYIDWGIILKWLSKRDSGMA
jgi:hypothetical protein